MIASTDVVAVVVDAAAAVAAAVAVDEGVAPVDVPAVLADVKLVPDVVYEGPVAVAVAAAAEIDVVGDEEEGLIERDEWLGVEFVGDAVYFEKHLDDVLVIDREKLGCDSEVSYLRQVDSKVAFVQREKHCELVDLNYFEKDLERVKVVQLNQDDYRVQRIERHQDQVDDTTWSSAQPTVGLDEQRAWWRPIALGREECFVVESEVGRKGEVERHC